MSGQKYSLAILLVTVINAFTAPPQTNSLSPDAQRAVSNLLSGLASDEAKAAFKARLAVEFPLSPMLPLHEFVGWLTNGPAVYTRTRLATTNYNNNPIFIELNRLGYPTPPLVRLDYYTNETFDHFLAGTLNHVCWTNFIGHTNARTAQIWSVRTHPVGWPAKPPAVKWNTKCLMWGMRGLTALSPCWEREEAPGWFAITALTRRHGYARGHNAGLEGFGDQFAGAKVWFLTIGNTVVERSICREVIRTFPVSGRDYTLFLFNEDLPDGISPMKVVAYKTRLAKYPDLPAAPSPLFLTEQTGNMSAEVPGFTVPIKKVGDSGSPNMLPIPGELVFYSGRTTAGPTVEMQGDMDELCRRSGLDPAKYQMQWIDLSAFPSY